MEAADQHGVGTWDSSTVPLQRTAGQLLPPYSDLRTRSQKSISQVPWVYHSVILDHSPRGACTWATFVKEGLSPGAGGESLALWPKYKLVCSSRAPLLPLCPQSSRRPVLGKLVAV